MNDTKIEWCDTTLNPVMGCKNNCPYCYARKLNYRFNFIKEWSSPRFFPKRLRQLECKKPKRIFMNSMSDIEYWEPAWVEKVSESIVANPKLIAATELSKTPLFLFIKDSLVNLVGKKNMKRELPINSIKRFDSLDENSGEEKD